MVLPRKVPSLTTPYHSNTDFFSWYSSANNQYLNDGVQFYWSASLLGACVDAALPPILILSLPSDDEGEDDYFTFTQWSLSQAAGLAAFDATRRYFSINRAFSPGAARIGAIVWTGDISPQWQDLQRTPGYVLNWGLAGAPYVTCDIGGFSGQTNGLLLTRWYGVGVFMPTMRVHSTNSATPHFPFPELWGEDASAAMRTLLQLRYALVPFLYSLGHETRATGVPICRPLALEFPGDSAGAANTAQWMVGDALLIAPVVTADNSTSAYLPALPAGPASWFEWGSATTHPAGTTLSLTDVPLDAVPVYVRPGSILPLAPLVQYTDALPCGPLAVAVYAGADGSFTLAEDDGETTSTATATLALSWSESTKCLSWLAGGASPNPAGARAFTQLSVVAYLLDGSTRTAPAVAIGPSGSACPK